MTLPRDYRCAHKRDTEGYSRLMRVYRLHDAAWSRIVTARVRRPATIQQRMATRRRPTPAVGLDGKLVLIAADVVTDPRTGAYVTRREMLDRVIEALAVPGVDGVIAHFGLLEELALLNVLEHRLAFCSSLTAPARSVAHHFLDGAEATMSWPLRDAADASSMEQVAQTVAELSDSGCSSIVHLRHDLANDRSEFDTEWSEWFGPVHAATSMAPTGAGLWLTIPAFVAPTPVAETTGLPVLVRDTDVPVDATAWRGLFSARLPLNVRGLIVGASGLFSLTHSVYDATAELVEAVRL